MQAVPLNTLGFVAPRATSHAEKFERCLLALVNEGAKILEEGIAANSHDIDLVYLNGYGFPAEQGRADEPGPILKGAAADLLAAFAHNFRKRSSANHWQPAAVDRTMPGGQRSDFC